MLPPPPEVQSPGMPNPVCSVSLFRWGRSSTWGLVHGRRAGEGTAGGALVCMVSPRDGIRKPGVPRAGPVRGCDAVLAPAFPAQVRRGRGARRRWGFPRPARCTKDARKRTKWTASGVGIRTPPDRCAQRRGGSRESRRSRRWRGRKHPAENGIQSFLKSRRGRLYSSLILRSRRRYACGSPTDPVGSGRGCPGTGAAAGQARSPGAMPICPKSGQPSATR